MSSVADRGAVYRAGTYHSVGSCALQAHGIQQPEMAALVKPSQRQVPSLAWCPVTCVPCRKYIGSWNVTGARCFAVEVERVMLRGRFSSGSKSGFRYSDQDWLLLMGSFSHLLYCESSSEERSTGNRHATLCGSRVRVTAPDDPVG